MSLYKPRQCMRQVSSNTQQQVETFKYLLDVIYLACDGRRSARRLIHGLVKLTQFCVSFIALWPQNGSFQTPQSCQTRGGQIVARGTCPLQRFQWPEEAFRKFFKYKIYRNSPQ